MKYVMFTNEKTGLKLPVLASDTANHCDLQMGAGWIPTSAGFFDLKSFSTVGKSESLKMSPATGDDEVIKMVMAGMECIMFIIQDTETNREQLKIKGTK